MGRHNYQAIAEFGGVETVVSIEIGYVSFRMAAKTGLMMVILSPLAMAYLIFDRR